MVFVYTVKYKPVIRLQDLPKCGFFVVLSYKPVAFLDKGNICVCAVIHYI